MQERPLHGKAVLIVEDEYLVASMMIDSLEDAGAKVVGPVSDIHMAADLLGNPTIRIDHALLDVNLRGKEVFPLADCLAEKKIPFVFVTGYECDFIPQRFQGAPCLTKPCEPEQVVAVLARS
ncbi:DNA-binding response OmpR family regulator [Pseudorhizobium tarimense]|uniref:DNA-binding response OmpR family regulator n=1 Tax=Pseudorhizobium tarimense TaxID=1079109 RepID=A0ABV2H2I1_9HYPH|nr:response regulator [Pseudorhizobium tarimense]MCJ8517676.1 response regulator [Pseudorhizobium tarimense]